MISKETLDDLVAIIIGILIFKCTSYLGWFDALLQKYAGYIIVVAIVVFFYRKKIISAVMG